MMTDKSDQNHYPLPDLTTSVDEPSYSVVLDWMKATKGRHVSFDFWARGNYIRHLLRNRANNIAPMLVRIKHPSEMSWAYKRLALLDIPVEFVYAGKCTKAKVLHLCPSDISIDSGWGYFSALGSQTKINGRSFFPILGYAKLMPEPVVDWLVNEASDEFLAGKVFVSPAELIGIDTKVTPGALAQLTEISGGTPVTDTSFAARTIMELNIPFIDKISLVDYRKLLNEYSDHLLPFRQSFTAYVAARSESEKKAMELLRHLCAEIEELTKADAHIRFRDVVGTLGGVLGLTAAIIGAVSGEMAAVVAASGAVMTNVKSAFAVHEHLRKKSHEAKKKVHASPHALFWRLGMAKPDKFNAVRKVQMGTAPKQSSSEFNENSFYHWLCPPAPGLQHLAVKKT